MKRKPTGKASLACASKRANVLIESMLKEMQRGLRDPVRMQDPLWIQLFGAKQSMVVNVQKLVQTLAALPQEPMAQDSVSKAHPEGHALTAEEMGLLTAWLAEAERGPLEGVIA